MTRCYTVNFSPTSETVAVDLIALAAADDIPIRIRSLRVWQTSDVGDAQDEILTVLIVRGNTTAGSGGAAGTQPPVLPKEAAASFTSRTGDTTAASAGTAVTVWSDGWNVRSPLDIIFPDNEMRGTDQGTGFLVVRLAAAPADAVTIGCAVDVWEMD